MVTFIIERYSGITTVCLAAQVRVSRLPRVDVRVPPVVRQNRLERPRPLQVATSIFARRGGLVIFQQLFRCHLRPLLLPSPLLSLHRHLVLRHRPQDVVVDVGDDRVQQEDVGGADEERVVDQGDLNCLPDQPSQRQILNDEGLQLDEGR